MPKVLSVDPTPNENAVRFTVEGAATSTPTTFKKENADDNAIAKAVFAIDGVTSVFMVNDFVTITKDPAASWGDLESPVKQAIESA